MLMLNTILALILLEEITSKSFASNLLSDLYLILQNLERGISHSKNPGVKLEI
jgi:hypothetical protein